MKHTLWCQLVMAFASRRVCTCGASPKKTKADARRSYRQMERRWREGRP